MGICHFRCLILKMGQVTLLCVYGPWRRGYVIRFHPLEFSWPLALVGNLSKLNCIIFNILTRNFARWQIWILMKTNVGFKSACCSLYIPITSLKKSWKIMENVHESLKSPTSRNAYNNIQKILFLIPAQGMRFGGLGAKPQKWSIPRPMMSLCD